MREWNNAFGFYTNHETASDVLKKVRDKGFRRAVLISRIHQKELIVKGYRPSSTMIGWTLFALAAALAFYLIIPSMILNHLPILELIFVGIVVWWIYDVREYRIGSDLIERLKNWIVGDESLLFVQVKPEQIPDVLALLRFVESGHPASFLIRDGVFPIGTEDKDLIREPLNLEQVNEKAVDLAQKLKNSKVKRTFRQPLLKRLKKSTKILSKIRHDVAEAENLEQTITSSAEWLLDNTYVIQGNIEEVQRNLPKKFYQDLPKIPNGPHKGIPRVYFVAKEIVACSGNRINRENITAFINSYQTVDPLTIGELWALPLMLRLRLIECIQYLAMDIDRRLCEGEKAGFWGNRLLNAARREPERLESYFAQLSLEETNPSPHFAEELFDHLFDEETILPLVKTWLETKFKENISEIIHREQIQKTAEQTAFSGAIVSLITLSQLSWREVFESVSAVDKIFDQDPDDVYLNMDFVTRDSYRKIVEKLARRSKKTESQIAHLTLKLALEGTDFVTKHVGYYLIDKGRPLLEKRADYKLSILQYIQRFMIKNPSLVYLGSILALLILLEIAFSYHHHFFSLLLLALIPASEAAIQIVNLILSRILPPFVLPKMYFEKGIPEQYGTLVIVPTMLSSKESIKENVNRLEIHYLANPDAALRFGLLVDFVDASAQHTELDLPHLECAEAGIKSLEEKYGPNRFFLFYRDRVFSKSENAWIGWERKRGKLESLNRYLTEGPHDGIKLQSGDPEAVKNILYVITLDSDTQLPKDTARQLVATLVHPLNRPIISNDGEIQRGYTIIQPRVSTNFVHSQLSLFTYIFSDEMSVDPYTQAVSNVYQDLMQEATYHGKGIYDVRAFHQILTDRFPEEHLLSHDLIEGIYGRVGFASDISLLDIFPKDYLTWAKRQHRWMRGDWQIIDWLFSKVPDSARNKVNNTLSIINQWKIFDNLRRAFLPVANFFLLLCAWLYSPDALFWTSLVILILFLPTINLYICNLFTDPRIFVLSKAQFINSFLRALISVALIPHQAYMSLDALAKVIYRRTFSKKKLLEWLVGHQLHITAKKRFILKMLLVSLFSVIVVGLVYWFNPQALVIAASVCFLWFISPLIIYFLDCSPIIEPIEHLSHSDRLFLRLAARKTWRYFDHFVGPQTNWLPPDNYQAALNIELAERTSPTNIGLWLLTVLSGYDFRYLTCDDVIQRTLCTFETFKKMEMYEGHLLNWYDTRNLRPLYPRYVSTVDSGNFLASLWTFEQGLQELLSAPILPMNVLSGLKDAFSAMCHAINDDRIVVKLQPLQGYLSANPKSHIELIGLIKKSKAWIEDFNKNENVENSTYGYWAIQLFKELENWESIISRYFSWVEIHPAERPNTSLLDLSLGRVADDLVVKEPQFKERLQNAEWFAGEKVGQVRQMIEAIHLLSQGMNMQFLYNQDRKLFSIGYQVDDRRLDNSYYDLLASEARIASLVSIAKDDVPLEHWWSLARSYRFVDGHQVLMSWGGTMFEYLMPLLFNFYFHDSLLGQACYAAVDCQIIYGKRRGIPWGISEAAYSELDMRRVYQYRSFGVPGLGFKQGLEEDWVVSPYSTALALAVHPKKAVKNLRKMSEGTLNMLSTYGFYESIDFARQHGPQGERGVIIYAFMAHHQGMSLLAFDNILHGNCMPRRFHSNPRIAGVEPILSEKVPIYPPIAKGFRTERPISRLTPFSTVPILGMVDTPHSATPKVNLLSNGEYSIMVTNSGGGYSRWKDIDITRWYADTTRDYWGSYCYIQDAQSKDAWSTSYHPLKSQGRNYSVSFKADKIEIRRRDHDIETITEIVVSPEDDAEIRMVTLGNLSKEERELQFTSYRELALAPHAADRAHPIFNKMFIETEALLEQSGLLAFRRLRSPHDQPIFAGHVIAVNHPILSSLQYETNRARFIGRGRTLENPLALDQNLSNSSGFVLDPIFSLRASIKLKPGERVQIAFVTMISDDRDKTVAMMKKYADISASYRALEMAWTNSQLELRHLKIHQEEAQLFQKLAGRILYPHSQLRPPTDQLKRNRLGQSALWAYGISGDLPIVAVAVADMHDIDLIKQVLTAHAFWRMRGLKVDLVILNEEAASYEHPLFTLLQKIIQSHSHHTEIGKPGGAYLINCDQIPPDDLTLLLSVSRANLIAARGFLRQQLVSPLELTRYAPRLLPNRNVSDEPSEPLPFMELSYFNQLGGFTKDGKEYVIFLGENTNTPAPWINVMANSTFGTLVTESGSGATWYGNSQTNRMTPWSNDPLINPIHDAIYIRDDELAIFWTATPSPIREKEAYRIRHGQGYTRFEHNSHGIDQELTIFVPVNDQGGHPLRIQRLKLKNTSKRKRSLSLFSYLEWVLGTDREETEMHVITEWDPESQAMFAYNRYNGDYGGHIAFVSSDPYPSSFTGNRTEFLGRNHHHSNPYSLRRRLLSGDTGAALDPCGALQVHIDLEPGEEREVVFTLGYAKDAVEARDWIQKARDAQFIERTFNETVEFWDRLLSTIQIETPDVAVNLTVNRWLLYQSLSCRYWGRTAFYQSSGAFGFRDQLQDVMALLYAAPHLAREHILYAASHQFEEGDVQHWWHPPSNGGVRTRISDDLLWLPFVTAQYVRVTKDLSILDEEVSFLKGDLLKEHEEESYFIPQISEEKASLLEHCRRAIHKGMTSGSHGLPLIGCGDWNDGMNLVGVEGRGESVWLAWFMIHVMNDFADLLMFKGQDASAEGFRVQGKRLAETIEKEAWDGNWYLRAYFDNGSPLGSNVNSEDKIDSLPQSWSVISGASDPERSLISLKSVEENLVKENEKMVLLLTPSFNKSIPDPGYIKGYPPGVRENGGQYTHGSLWVPMAFARINEGDKAAHLLHLMLPQTHSYTLDDVNLYRVEPYAVVADVYWLPGQEGRGGWSWYTGAAAWMYRIWLEEVLGFKLSGDRLKLEPVLPVHWNPVKIFYRYINTPYEIIFENLSGQKKARISIEVDGVPQQEQEIVLKNDGMKHTILCRILER